MNRTPSVFQLALPGAPLPEALAHLEEPAIGGVLREAERLGVFPAVFSRLRQAGAGPLPDGGRRRVQASMAQNLVLRAEQDSVLRQLRQAGVPCQPVRGISLTERLYPNLSWRTVADVDVLIHAADVPNAYGALKSQGLTDAENSWNPKALALLGRREALHHPELRFLSRQGVSIELHWDWLEESLPEDGLFCAPEAYLVYLARHAGKHFWWDLRWLTDIELFLRAYDREIDWYRVWALARKNKAARPCAATFELCACLFGRELRPEQRQCAQSAGKRLAREAKEWLIEGKQDRFSDRPVVQLLRVDGAGTRVRRVFSWLAPTPRHWTRPDGSTPSTAEVWLSRYRRFGFLALAAVCPARSWRRRLRKASELSSHEWSLLLHAWLLLPLVAIAIRTVRFPRLQAWAGRLREGASPHRPAWEARRAGELVDTAARFHVVPLLCLPRSLVLLRLLSLQGITAALRMGVRRENGLILGHAWVEHGGEAVNDPDRPQERYESLVRALDQADFDVVATSRPPAALSE